MSRPQQKQGSPDGALATVDQFLVLERVRDSEFGPVFRCRDRHSRAEVMLRACPDGLSENTLDRLRSAAHELGGVVHPCVVGHARVHVVADVQLADSQTTEPVDPMPIKIGDVFIVLPWTSALTLGEWIAQRPDGVVTREMGLRFCSFLAAALDALHDQGIVHGEVCASQIHVSPDSTPLLLAAGLGRIMRGAESTLPPDMTDVERCRAPEQWRGEALTPAADQYALAALTYESVAGRHPLSGAFDAPDVEGILQRVETLYPVEIFEFTPEQNAALLRALSRSGADRFGSCSELSVALSGEPERAAGLPLAELLTRQNVRRVALAAACLLVLFVGIKLVGGRSGRKVAEPERAGAQNSAKVLAKVRQHIREKNGPEALRCLDVSESRGASRRVIEKLRGEALQIFTRSQPVALQAETEEAWRRLGQGSAKAVCVAEQDVIDGFLNEGRAALAADDYGGAYVAFRKVAARVEQLQANAKEHVTVGKEIALRLAEARGGTLDLKTPGAQLPASDWAPIVTLLEEGETLLEKGDLAAAKTLAREGQIARDRLAVGVLKGQYETLRSALSEEEIQRARVVDFTRAVRHAEEADGCAIDGRWGDCVDLWLKAATEMRAAVGQMRSAISDGDIIELINRTNRLAYGERSRDVVDQIRANCREALDILDAVEAKAEEGKPLMGRGIIVDRRAFFKKMMDEAWGGPQTGNHSSLEDLNITLCWIQPGRSVLGSNPGERDWAAGPVGGGEKAWYDDEGEHQRSIHFETGFWLGATEVTRGQWRVFLAETAYQMVGGGKDGAWCYDSRRHRYQMMLDKSWVDPGYGIPDVGSEPVTCVSWRDAVAFCKWLTKRESDAGRVRPGFEYRLPTEAEWEYACRAGTESMFWWGSEPSSGSGRVNGASDDDSNGDGFGWFADRSRRDGFEWVRPVDHGNANRYGLRDMLGNVWEWCLDTYSPEGASASYRAGSGSKRVVRGGSFKHGPGSLRCANRAWGNEGIADFDVGFRVCFAGVLETASGPDTIEINRPVTP